MTMEQYLQAAKQSFKRKMKQSHFQMNNVYLKINKIREGIKSRPAAPKILKEVLQPEGK